MFTGFFYYLWYMEEFTKEELENEVWKPVPGLENFCLVSDLGRFKKLRYKKLKEDKILKLGHYPNGYVQFSTTIDRIRHTAIAHRIVAKVFVDNPENKPEVNHLDEVKDNNRASNLEWATSKENSNYSIEKLKNNLPKGENSPSSVLNKKQVEKIRLLKGKLSYRKIAKKYNVSYSTIQNIFSGRTWYHKN